MPGLGDSKGAALRRHAEALKETKGMSIETRIDILYTCHPPTWSVAASDFFTGGSRFFSLRPGIRWPIFSAGRIRQNIKVQNLRQEQGLLAYEQAVLIALEEVENALTASRQAQLRLIELTEAEKAYQRAAGSPTTWTETRAIDNSQVHQYCSFR